MELKINDICNEYKEVHITYGNAIIKTGLLDKKECAETAERLRQAADELENI